MKVFLERINDDFVFEVKNQNGHSVILDNISKLNGKVMGVSPMELLLMGVAGCSSIDVVSILKKQKKKISSLKMEVNGIREKGKIPSLFSHINIHVSIEGNISKKKVIQAVSLSFDKYCSVSKTLESTAKISYTIILNGEKI
ncbi:MAG: OsmC family protein [Flavobacteriaceae bacterium]|nr:OsmC family protein [Flavobacteriaceae bacterium]